MFPIFIGYLVHDSLVLGYLASSVCIFTTTCDFSSCFKQLGLVGVFLAFEDVGLYLNFQAVELWISTEWWRISLFAVLVLFR